MKESLKRSAAVSVWRNAENFDAEDRFIFASSVPKDVADIVRHLGFCRQKDVDHRPCISYYLEQKRGSIAMEIAAKFSYVDTIDTICRGLPFEIQSYILERGISTAIRFRQADFLRCLLSIYKRPLKRFFSMAVLSVDIGIVTAMSEFIDDEDVYFCMSIGYLFMKYVETGDLRVIDYLSVRYPCPVINELCQYSIRGNEPELFRHMVRRLQRTEDFSPPSKYYEFRTKDDIIYKIVSECLYHGKIEFLEILRNHGIFNGIKNLPKYMVSDLVGNVFAYETTPGMSFHPRALLFLVDVGLPYLRYLPAMFDKHVSEDINDRYLKETERTWKTKAMLMAAEDSRTFALRVMVASGFETFPELDELMANRNIHWSGDEPLDIA